MNIRSHRAVTRLSIAAAVLLGLGVAAGPTLAGDHGHRRHHGYDSGADETRLFGQIVVSLLGAAQPRTVHYHTYAPPHPRRVWHHRHGFAPVRECTEVSRIVVDRFGNRSKVVTRDCDFVPSRSHRRSWGR